MPLAPDDDMIMHTDAQMVSRLGNLLRDVDIGPAGFRRAGRVIVDHPAEFAIYLIFSAFSDGHMKVVPGVGGCA